MGKKLLRLVQIVLTPVATIFAVLAAGSGAALIRNPQTFRILAVVRESRQLLANPENDFSASTWLDGEAALDELDRYIAKLEAGETDLIDDLRLLFAPTGNLQEVSIASGWGEAYLKIAARFDVAARGS